LVYGGALRKAFGLAAGVGQAIGGLSHHKVSGYGLSGGTVTEFGELGANAGTLLRNLLHDSMIVGVSGALVDGADTVVVSRPVSFGLFADGIDVLVSKVVAVISGVLTGIF